uniref:Uncharacterized protein n=1 Tax=Rousettus aegyptiacus TaxID=9407 RepID=A0A7J8FHX1_ROUAE|nr:hypothetical protein HJG63_011815 [Rousettus aegyptiacus]
MRGRPRLAPRHRPHVLCDGQTAPSWDLQGQSRSLQPSSSSCLPPASGPAWAALLPAAGASPRLPHPPDIALRCPPAAVSPRSRPSVRRGVEPTVRWVKLARVGPSGRARLRPTLPWGQTAFAVPLQHPGVATCCSCLPLQPFRNFFPRRRPRRSLDGSPSVGGPSPAPPLEAPWSVSPGGVSPRDWGTWASRRAVASGSRVGAAQ